MTESGPTTGGSTAADAAPGTIDPAAARDLLDGVLAASTDAIVVVAPDGSVAAWSAAAERLFGVPDSDVVGLPLSRLFAPSADGALADAVDGLRSGATRRITLLGDRPGGSRMLADVTCTRAPSGNGAARGYVAVVRDVTEPTLVRAASAAVALERDPSAALAAFGAVLRDVVPHDHLTLTAAEDGHARRIASVGRFVAGLPPGKRVPLEASHLGLVVSRRLPVLCRDTREAALPLDRVLAESGLRSYVVLPLFRRGDVVAALNVGFAPAGAPTAGIVQLLTAVTQAVTPAILHLVTVGDQEEMIRRLEDLDALKNEFIALMTHDMRTPLAVIAGFASVLRVRWREMSDAERADNLGAIDRNAVALVRLVEGGLQVARIESGAFHYDVRPVRLEDGVRRTAADIAATANRSIHVTVADGLPEVRCDPDRHWQILMNLLANAITFSPPDSAIEVDVAFAAGAVRVSVRDHGPGIAPADVPKLFQKFSRVGPRRTTGTGAGLGLYICRAMVEAQGGRIWAESELGRGSTFVYELPVAG